MEVNPPPPMRMTSPSKMKSHHSSVRVPHHLWMAKRRRREERMHNQIGNSQSKGVHYESQLKEAKEKQPKKNLKPRFKIIDRAFKSKHRLLLKRFQN